MTYIYDILLNFNEYLYEFYEWNTSDNLTHARKIPIFKVTTKDLFKIANNIFDIDKISLRLIMNKTEIFTSRKIEQQKYMCLVSDGQEVIAIKINENGRCHYKSKMLIDEENEALEVVNRMKIADLKIKIIQSKSLPKYQTRNQIETQKNLISEINKLKKNKQNDVLRYLYFECTNGYITNIETVIKTLHSLVITNPDNCNQKLNNIIKLISTNKSV